MPLTDAAEGIGPAPAPTTVPLVAACVVLSLVCLCLSAFILYIFCSKKYKLNWYERNLLEASKSQDLGIDLTSVDGEENAQANNNNNNNGSNARVEKLKRLFRNGKERLTLSFESASPPINPTITTQVSSVSKDEVVLATVPNSGAFNCNVKSASSDLSSGSDEVCDEEEEAEEMATSWQMACQTANQKIAEEGMERRESNCSGRESIVLKQKSIDETTLESDHEETKEATSVFRTARSLLSRKKSGKLEEDEETLASGGSQAGFSTNGVDNEILKKRPSSDVVRVAGDDGGSRGGEGGAGGGGECIFGKVKKNTGRIDPDIYKDEIASAKTPTEEVDLGALNLTLRFEAETNVFTVKLVQAQALVPRDFSGTASPYCRISLLPGRRSQLQSRVIRGTTNPVWEEEFSFEIAAQEIETKTVEICLFDFDQYSRDECIGQATLPLGGIDFSEKVDVWKPVSPPDKAAWAEVQQRVKGDLMFSLGYLPSAERLTVVVMKARNLKPLDPEKLAADPYVKVSLSYAGKRLKKKKTSTKTSTLTPTFNEALVFQLGKEFLPNVCLEVAVIDNALLGQKQMIGKIDLGPEALGEERDHWLDLINVKSPTARWHSVF